MVSTDKTELKVLLVHKVFKGNKVLLELASQSWVALNQKVSYQPPPCLATVIL
jgi:hypothetical protein